MRMIKKSRLHLPRVPARPGETLISATFNCPAARCPDRSDARACDMASLSVAGARSMMRGWPWVRGIRTRCRRIGALAHMLLTQ